jgi:multidrug efflux pump subunit AcrA (membrane-fusion protein)
MASPGPRRALRRTLVKGGCVAVVAVIAGVSLYSAQSSGAPAYRTATAMRSTVSKTLDVTGTLAPVNQAAVSFQVAGTVASVAVTTGQHVNAGQVLASLSPTSLQEAVSAAQTTLAADQAKLSEDEAGQTTTASSAAGAGATTAAAASGTSPIILTAASASGSTAALQAAQQAVVNAQQKADQDSQVAAADLAAAETTCSATSGSPTGGSPSTTTPTTSTPSTAAPTSTSTTTTPGAGGSNPSQACTTALNTAMNAQSQVSSDQKAVSTAETALAKLLSSAASSVANPTSGGTGKSGSTNSGSSSATPGRSTGGSSTGSSAAGAGNGGKSPATGASGAGAGSGSGSGSTQTVTNSAAQLATDQAAIDSASAVVVQDQQSLADAQLTTPIAGTVASIAVSAGQSVSAGSSSSTITVINSGGYQTTSSLTPTQVNQVAVGDAVQVSVYGTSGTISGTVSRVGPVTVGSSSDTYPVIVALATGASTMSAGSTAAVNIGVASAANALVVPTSAVHTSSPGRSYVIVLQSGKEKQTPVTVGVAGATYTQITSGLTQGQTVILADPSQALPSSNTSSTGGGFGGAGGFPGGGFRGTGATGVAA